MADYNFKSHDKINVSNDKNQHISPYNNIKNRNKYADDKIDHKNKNKNITKSAEYETGLINNNLNKKATPQFKKN